MSLVNSIASLSMAQSAAQLRTDVSTRVMKMAMDQNQVVADLLAATMENVGEMMAQTTGDLGTQVDVRA